MFKHYQRILTAVPDVTKTLDRLNQALWRFGSRFEKADGNTMGAAAKAVQQLRDMKSSTMPSSDADWKTAVDKAATSTHQAATCIQDKAKEVSVIAYPGSFIYLIFHVVLVHSRSPLPCRRYCRRGALSISPGAFQTMPPQHFRIFQPRSDKK